MKLTQEEHKRIYLAPICGDCASDDRIWCEDDQGPCDCGAEWAAYDIATKAVAPTNTREALAKWYTAWTSHEDGEEYLFADEMIKSGLVVGGEK